ncbi:hypothetical protein DCS_03439 [Drechmeria coniospora]|uniref:Uncharacterized protein n=1 Tax=Drechmeria coniospora TaxID=98403 RepID=A0A151GH96_DRECN|nr:hypothetical protein DCS_03439 [Drechmeria coniospora]KAH8836237.1 hypothetical protein RJ55_10062 [Drechmeria coniospora]KYK56439.1 hypothetical protein DCS_03439 [Drechmeria coniospora]
MFSAILCAALLFTKCARGATSVSWDDIEDIKKNLKESFTIDDKNRPYSFELQDTVGAFFSCGSFFSNWNAHLLYRDTLMQANVVDIKYTKHNNLKEPVINKQCQPIPYKSQKSKADLISVTKGWKIGGTLEGEIGGSAGIPKGKLTVAGEYSESVTVSQTVTELEEATGSCDPGQECFMVALIFYAEVTGRCKREPILDCAEKLYTCDRKEAWDNDRDTAQYWLDYCPQGDSEVDCTVRFQIFENDTPMIRNIAYFKESDRPDTKPQCFSQPGPE